MDAKRGSTSWPPRLKLPYVPGVCAYHVTLIAFRALHSLSPHLVVVSIVGRGDVLVTCLRNRGGCLGSDRCGLSSFHDVLFCRLGSSHTVHAYRRSTGCYRFLPATTPGFWPTRTAHFEREPRRKTAIDVKQADPDTAVRAKRVCTRCGADGLFCAAYVGSALAVDRGGTVSSSSIALCLPSWGMPALLECLFLVHTTRDLAPSRLSLRRRPRLVSLIVRVDHLPPPLQPFPLFFPLKMAQAKGGKCDVGMYVWWMGF